MQLQKSVFNPVDTSHSKIPRSALLSTLHWSEKISSPQKRDNLSVSKETCFIFFTSFHPAWWISLVCPYLTKDTRGPQIEYFPLLTLNVDLSSRYTFSSPNQIFFKIPTLPFSIVAHILNLLGFWYLYCIFALLVSSSPVCRWQSFLKGSSKGHEGSLLYEVICGQETPVLHLFSEESTMCWRVNW